MPGHLITTRLTVIDNLEKTPENPLSIDARYWQMVYKGLGSDDEKMRQLLLNEHSGMGVVAALLATMDVTCLMFTPTSYRADNAYNQYIGWCLVNLLALSLALCTYCIMMTFFICACVLKTPNNMIMMLVGKIKGNPMFEVFVWLLLAFLSMILAVCALIYLINGGLVCGIASGLLVMLFLVVLIQIGVLERWMRKDVLKIM